MAILGKLLIVVALCILCPPVGFILLLVWLFMGD